MNRVPTAACKPVEIDALCTQFDGSMPALV